MINTHKLNLSREFWNFFGLLPGIVEICLNLSRLVYTSVGVDKSQNLGQINEFQRAPTTSEQDQKNLTRPD